MRGILWLNPPPPLFQSFVDIFPPNVKCAPTASRVSSPVIRAVLRSAGRATAPAVPSSAAAVGEDTCFAARIDEYGELCSVSLAAPCYVDSEEAFAFGGLACSLLRLT